MKYYILILITLFAFVKIYSQEKSPKDIDWLSIGVGIGENKHMSNFLSYAFIGKNVYQVSINGNQEFSIFHLADPDYVVATTFSRGQKIDWEFIFGGLFAGPSLVFGKRNGEQIKYTVGINLNSQVLFSPTDVLGVGIDVFGNLNFYESFYGIRMAIYFKSIK